MTRSLALIAICIGLLPLHADAQKGGKPAAPTPLVVVDATGRVAGRVLGFETAIVSVNAAHTPVRILFPQDASLPLGTLTWVPWDDNTQRMYFSTNDCSGPPLVNTNIDRSISTRYGFRPSVVMLDAALNVMLYVGTSAAAQPTTYSSRLSYPVCLGGPGGSNCGPIACTVEGGTVPAVPIESTVNMTLTYSPPLTIQ